MRVGFISDPVVTTRGGRLCKMPPLALLSTAHAWRAVVADVYVGVVELDAGQVQDLLTQANALGIRLALVIDVDKASGTQPYSVAEGARLAGWMNEKGLPGPGSLEGQIDYVQRLALLLDGGATIDRTFAGVEDEVTTMQRQAR